MSDGSLSNLEGFFLALSDGTRLRLLNLMRHGGVSVGYLSDVLGQSQPKISRHLAYLRTAGLVETRRDGKWIYYRIDFPRDRFAARLLNDALDWVSESTGESRNEYRYYVAAEDELAERVDTEYEPNEIEIYLL